MYYIRLVNRQTFLKALSSLVGVLQTICPGRGFQEVPVEGWRRAREEGRVDEQVPLTTGIHSQRGSPGEGEKNTSETHHEGA